MTPKIAYVGDVSASATSSGMLLLYRLFEGYAPERLIVFETAPSPTNLRLDLVEYAEFGVFRRLRRTRFNHIYTSMALAANRFDAWRVAGRLAERGIDAILSVTHGTSWLVADRVASALRVPLVLVSHDYWFDTCPALGYSAVALHSMFGDVYRRARLRFCISPQMETHYSAKYGAHGSVLYPTRAVSIRPKQPRGEGTTRPFTVAYAGTVTHKGYRAALQGMARALARIGGVLLVYSNLSSAVAGAIAGDARNVVFRDFVPSTEIIDRLRSEADALFIPMPAEMGLNARIAFPSKLADYTSVGLPIIVYGPKDSSVYGWALDFPLAAIAVAQGEELLLEESIARLAANPALRDQMGLAAFEIGSQQFDAKMIQEKMIAMIAYSKVD